MCDTANTQAVLYMCPCRTLRRRQSRNRNQRYHCLLWNRSGHLLLHVSLRSTKRFRLGRPRRRCLRLWRSERPHDSERCQRLVEIVRCSRRGRHRLGGGTGTTSVHKCVGPDDSSPIGVPAARWHSHDDVTRCRRARASATVCIRKHSSLSTDTHNAEDAAGATVDGTMGARSELAANHRESNGASDIQCASCSRGADEFQFVADERASEADASSTILEDATDAAGTIGRGAVARYSFATNEINSASRV